MRIGDNKSGSGEDIFEQADYGDMILPENAIEHVIRFLEVLTLHGNGAKFDESLFYKLIPTGRIEKDKISIKDSNLLVGFVESGTSVDLPSIRVVHCLIP